MTDLPPEEISRLRQDLTTVREVLRTEWDPIGVGAVSHDEYDPYADRVYNMLVFEDASSSEVSRYLHMSAYKTMGMSNFPTETSEMVARELVRLANAFWKPTR